MIVQERTKATRCNNWCRIWQRNSWKCSLHKKVKMRKRSGTSTERVSKTASWKIYSKIFSSIRKNLLLTNSTLSKRWFIKGFWSQNTLIYQSAKRQGWTLWGLNMPFNNYCSSTNTRHLKPSWQCLSIFVV
jgi:hypothetical protein